MFADASSFDQDLCWDLKEAVYVGSMFAGSLGSFNVSCVTTNADLRLKLKVSEWCNDAASAEATYGHISGWDTSGVEDMSRLFSRYDSSWTSFQDENGHEVVEEENGDISETSGNNSESDDD